MRELGEVQRRARQIAGARKLLIAAGLSEVGLLYANWASSIALYC